MSLPIAPPAPSGRWKAVALRTIEVMLAFWLAIAASTKLYGSEAMVQTFDTIGVGQWFRVITGVIELSAAALLLMRGTTAFGAILAAAVMIGAASAISSFWIKTHCTPSSRH